METKQNSARIIVHPATRELLNNTNNVIYVKPYSALQLSVLYGISRKTFIKWIRPFQGEIGERMGNYFNVRQVKIIFEKLDVPHLMHVA